MRNSFLATGCTLIVLGTLAAHAVIATADNASPAGETIDVETIVPASPADVWRALTTNEGMQEFLTPATKIELRIGGPYEIYFAPDGPEGERGSEDCVVLSYIPHEMLSFNWNAPPHLPNAREQRTWVVIRMEPNGDGTRVHLVHLGWDDMKQRFPEHSEEWDEAKEYFEMAWSYVLNALVQRFKQGPRWDDDGEMRW